MTYQIEMTHNAKFSRKSGLDWLKRPILVILQVFPHNEAQIHSEWPFSCNSQLFVIFCQQSISFHPKSQKFAFLGGEGTLANFLSFSTFWIPFTPNWLKMTHNGEFCCKSGLDWLKMANFGHFVGFTPYFPIILWVFQLFQFLSHQTG